MHLPEKPMILLIFRKKLLYCPTHIWYKHYTYRSRYLVELTWLVPRLPQSSITSAPKEPLEDETTMPVFRCVGRYQRFAGRTVSWFAASELPYTRIFRSSHVLCNQLLCKITNCFIKLHDSWVLIIWICIINRCRVDKEQVQSNKY